MTTTRTNALTPVEDSQQELRSRRLLAFLERDQLAWHSKDHPELHRGAAAWVSKTRRSEQKLRDGRTAPFKR
jgi:hypothetical protein